MRRVLDLSALRSFVAVADTGGVTRAANLLNLTQSAVSMQMKRLEEALDVQLLDRSARTVTLTAAGEQLLGYSRKMLALNDEAVSRLTDTVFEGELTLGVPHDIIYPHIPGVLQRFNVEFPRMRVHLLSSYTRKLKEEFARGDCDLILTTEESPDAQGETLAALPLVWIGAPGGIAWKQRPLRLGFEPGCMFRAPVQQALDQAGIEWDMAVESDSSRTIEASLSADLAVGAVLSGTASPQLDEIAHGGALPQLPSRQINLYVNGTGQEPPVARMAELVRAAYQTRRARAVA
ncbi:LysR family transcriptional regulator [Fluviibacterium sp. DFM31]|uniref:LysR family transcriptional regulator n=1 Tax=Meridianimarinicoccus marinus TaxID=3231483 RepID=A0ABV3L4V5_9RHOB